MKNWMLFGNGDDKYLIDTWMKNGNNTDGSEYGSFPFVNLTIGEIEEAKKWMVLKVLKKYNGNKTKAAEHLGLSYAGLLKMLKTFDEEKM